MLASRSPQRRALLDQLGVDFEVRHPEVLERTQGEPAAVALANARSKAAAVAASLDDASGASVLGVNTLVALDGRIFGKPADATSAAASLRALSGAVHEVLSGLALLGPGGERVHVERTEVEFRELDDDLLAWYVVSGEWRERAGGYAIQGKGAALVRRIRGDWTNVVGLPVAALLELAPGLLTPSG